MEKLSENKILNEKDPYLREIWAAGYDEVQDDMAGHRFLLLRHSDKHVHEVSKYDLYKQIFTIKTGINRFNGEAHYWISEADGSCERFRNLIGAKY